MKRLFSLWAVCALIFAVSCGDALNDAGKNENGETITVTEDNAKYVYLQKLYDDSFSREAYAAATSGIQSWDTDGSSYKAESRSPSRVIIKDPTFYESVENLVNDILTMNTVKAADPNYVMTGGMWWTVSDIAADSLVNTLKSDMGKSVIQTTIDSMKVKDAATNPVTFAETLGKDLFEPLSNIFGWGDNSTDYTPYFQKICDQLAVITDKLNTIQTNIATLMGITYTTLMRTDEENFVDAMTYYSALTTDLKAKGYADKLSTIKTYLVDSSAYDEHLTAAFKSAKQRTADLKANYTGATPITQIAPFNFFLSDMIFLHQMSKTRMELVSMVMKGHDLLNYRGVKAKSDLAMVQEMKDGVWIAMQSMDANNRTQCIDAYAFLVAWEVTLRAHMAAASIGSDVTLAKDIARHGNNGYGTFGTLGSYGNILRKTDGTNLVSPVDMVNGKDLTSLFDSYNSGDMAKGKYARITVNGTSILNMGLTPVFRYFTSNYDSPPANQVYVDPLNGTYILPKPIFWDIFEPSSAPIIGSIASSTQFDYRSDGLFGAAAGGTFQTHNGSAANVSRTVNINAAPSFYKEGTLSVFVKLFGETKVHHKTPKIDSNGYINGYTEEDTYPSWDYGDATLHCNGYVKIGGSGFDLTISHASTSTNLVGTLTINGAAISVGSMGSANAWHHVYIVWSVDGSLNGGNTARIYIDGVNKYSTSTKFTMTSMRMNYSTDVVATADRYACDINSGHGSVKANLDMYSTSYISVDNLKLWNQVVSENASWINALKTNEVALHPVYGSANQYRPQTVNVSYYRNSVLGKAE